MRRRVLVPLALVSLAFVLLALQADRFRGLLFILPLPFIFVGRGPKAVLLALAIFAVVFVLLIAALSLGG